MPCNNNSKRRTSSIALASTRYGHYPCRSLLRPHLHSRLPPSLGPHPSHPQSLSQLLQAGGEAGAGYAADGSPHAVSHCTLQHLLASAQALAVGPSGCPPRARLHSSDQAHELACARSFYEQWSPCPSTLSLRAGPDSTHRSSGLPDPSPESLGPTLLAASQPQCQTHVATGASHLER